VSDYWPQSTFEAALEVFGPAVYQPTSRTYKALDGRIRHALRVWGEKFGPLNAKQEQYADEILAFCIRKAQREAGGDRAKLWPYAQAGIGRAIMSERAETGMKSRRDTVDGSALLAELLA